MIVLALHYAKKANDGHEGRIDNRLTAIKG
jgi:hypothetical protein